MTLQQLRYVIETANCGSMTQAAQRLFVTQPSLSGAIRELEKELGVELFLRTNRGICLSADGAEFLGYARQVLEQAELLESRYGKKTPDRLLAVSTQHYAFAVNAFAELVKAYGKDEYAFTLRETTTHDIIEDVKNGRSELGLLYMSRFNEQVIGKMLDDAGLVFNKLFRAEPHVFIKRGHPLAERQSVAPEDLEDYPCLSFEQGIYNSFYFSEEPLSTLAHSKSIRVSDRATLFNLLVELGGYTVSSGVLGADINEKDIVSVSLDCDEYMDIGYITRGSSKMSSLAESYIDYVKKVCEK